MSRAADFTTEWRSAGADAADSTLRAAGARATFILNWRNDPMAENATIEHDHLKRGRRLISHLQTIVVALSEAEYHAATILAFDPEASVPEGIFANPPLSLGRRLDGSHLTYRGWVLLARACTRGGQSLDDSSCLAAFLSERAVTADSHTEATHHDPA